MGDLFTNNEATQNINIISNFQPDMTANFVLSVMKDEASEEQKVSSVT